MSIWNKIDFALEIIIFCGFLGWGMLRIYSFLYPKRLWIPCKKPPCVGIKFQGDSRAVPRTFFSNRWRRQWMCILFEVPSRAVSDGYSMYYGSKDSWRQYFFTCRRRYVVVLLGPGEVTFAATALSAEGQYEVPLARVCILMEHSRLESWMYSQGITDVLWI